MSEFHGGPNPPQQQFPQYTNAASGQQPTPPVTPPFTPPRKSHKLRTILIVVGAVFALLIVAAVLTPSAPQKQTTGTAPAVAETTAPPASVSTPPAVEEPTPTPTPTDSGIAKVGAKEWFTYTDGMQVQVTKIARFKISEYAAGGKPGDVGVVVTVTVKNGSGEVFDASAVNVQLSAGPNGDEADTVYDSDAGVMGGFEGSIPVGRSKTAKVGFAVPKAQLKQLVVEVAPSWDHDASFFEGAVK